MKNIKILLLMVIGLVSISTVKGQKGITKVEVNYSANFPTSSFKDLVSDPSFRGIDLKIMHNINDKMSVGLTTGFQDFYQKYPRAVYKLGDGSEVSAVVSNSVQTVPLLATFHYNFSPTQRLQPFAGVGVGGNMILYRQFLGEFSDSKNKFAFQAQPKIGVYFPFREGGPTGLTLSGYYNIIPFKYNGTTNLNSFGVSLGISFPTRSY
jgi:opacity protein-like surface antigen